MANNTDNAGKHTPGIIDYNEISMNESAFEIITLSPNGQNSNGYIAKIQCSLYTVPGQAKANAERIVKAWNEYDQLKARNEKLESIIKKFMEFTGKLAVINGGIHDATQEAKEALKGQ
jgi:hypothetical protein